MRNDKINHILSKRAESPAPELSPEPFLSTRIEALAEAQAQKSNTRVANWSFASAIAAGALVLGIYVGLGISDNPNSTESETIFSDYTEAIYQVGVSDNWSAASYTGGEE